MSTTFIATLQIIVKTDAELTALGSPWVPLKGQLFKASDTGYSGIGDGVTAYSALPKSKDSGENTGDQDISGLVEKNADITPATKTKITYDEKGLVTAGDDATTADITESTDKNYVTDAQLVVIENTVGSNNGDQDLSPYQTIVNSDAGDAATLSDAEDYTDAEITALKDGVTGTGDTLQKLYNLILGSFTQVTVANISARNAYNVPQLPFNILVTDDGDTRWALYTATTTGVGATFLKLSDPDLLNAVMSNAAIKTAYESNSDTNAFTNALLSKLNALDSSLYEAVANKDTDGTLAANSDTKYASQKAVRTYVAAQISGLTTYGRAIVRHVYMTQDSTDVTREGGASGKTYNTFTAAYAAADALQVANGGLVHLHVGNITAAQAAGLTLSAAWNSSVILIGNSFSTSFLGNITATNTGDGYAVNITGFNVTIGTINSSSTSLGNAGAVTINGDLSVGAVTLSGAGSTGIGGALSVGATFVGKAIIASVTTVGGSGSGASGAVTLTNGTIVTGTVTMTGGTTGAVGAFSCTVSSEVRGLSTITTKSASVAGGSLTCTNAKMAGFTYANSGAGGATGTISITQNSIVTSTATVSRSSSGKFGAATFSNSFFTAVTYTYASTSSVDDTITPVFTNCTVTGAISLNYVTTTNTHLPLTFSFIGGNYGSFTYNHRGIGTGLFLKANIFKNCSFGSVSVACAIAQDTETPRMYFYSAYTDTLTINMAQCSNAGALQLYDSFVGTLLTYYVPATVSAQGLYFSNSIITDFDFASNTNNTVIYIDGGYINISTEIMTVDGSKVSLNCNNAVVSVGCLTDVLSVEYVANNCSSYISLTDVTNSIYPLSNFTFNGGNIQGFNLEYAGKFAIKTVNTTVDELSVTANIINKSVTLDIDAPAYSNVTTYYFGDFQKTGTATYMCVVETSLGQTAPHANWFKIYDVDDILLIPTEFSYVNKINLTATGSSSLVVDKITNLPNVPAVNNGDVEFTSENGKTMAYNQYAIGGASSNHMVGSSGNHTDSVVGRTNGGDSITFRKTGTFNQRRQVLIMA